MIAKNEHYIRTYPNALTKEFCDRVIDMFEKSDKLMPGDTLGGVEPHKRSMDMYVKPTTPEWTEVNNTLYNSMGRCLNEYMKEFSRCFAPFKDVGDVGYKILRYEPITGGFDEHIDVTSLKSSSRFLAGVWYLNDIPEGDGGETKFFVQDIAIRPEAGKMVLFPPFFTHPHAGTPSKSHRRYIINTFVQYLNY